MAETIFNRFFRSRINKKNKKKLKNTEFSVISSNCNGGIICHDLNMKFRSPFVNLWLKPKDYIKFLQNMEYYLNCELSFTNEEGIDYPIGVLDDIKIYFTHYENEDIAKTKWLERLKRLNLNNLFILFTDRDGCTLEDIKNFDQLPYKNKIIFVHKEYPEIKSAYYIKGFEKEDSVGKLGYYINKYSGKRYLDYFNYVKWFNGEN